MTVGEGAGGTFLLTVSGTGSLSDVTDCEATVSDSCELTATCVHEDGSSVTHTLVIYSFGFTGRASVTTTGGGCTVPFDVDGQRS